MSSGEVPVRAELFFRAYVHAVLPLHMALVDELMGAPHVPLELATVLEDIGQAYMRAADNVNAELVRRDQLRHEPDVDNAMETRIEAFVTALVARAGRIEFGNGRAIDARRALESFPMAGDAIRTALQIEIASR